MNTENIILVGAVWSVVLLVLLVLREFLRAIRLRSRARIMPVLDRLVVVMIIAPRTRSTQRRSRCGWASISAPSGCGWACG